MNSACCVAKINSQRKQREKVERGKRTAIAWSNKFHIENRATSIEIRLNNSELQAALLIKYLSPTERYL